MLCEAVRLGSCEAERLSGSYEPGFYECCCLVSEWRMIWVCPGR